jgi:SnoaL-like domain
MSETRATNPDAAVRLLLDKEEIRDALLRYCRGVDRMDNELILSAYHPDATEHHGGFRGETPEDFIAYADERSGTFQSTSHFVTNHTIELAGDVAYSEAYVLVVHHGDGPDGPHEAIFGGRYVDRFERRDGQWKIADRAVVHDWARVDQVRAWERAPMFVQGLRSREDVVYRHGLPGPGAANRAATREREAAQDAGASIANG